VSVEQRLIRIRSQFTSLSSVWYGIPGCRGLSSQPTHEQRPLNRAAGSAQQHVSCSRQGRAAGRQPVAAEVGHHTRPAASRLFVSAARCRRSPRKAAVLRRKRAVGEKRGGEGLEWDIGAKRGVTLADRGRQRQRFPSDEECWYEHEPLLSQVMAHACDI
jgi:hypothetical protein